MVLGEVLRVLAELATTAFSLAGRHWVRAGGRGGRRALLARFADAIKAIPAASISQRASSGGSRCYRWAPKKPIRRGVMTSGGAL